ncbi:MAG: XylR family transcriptional regulator [Phycisphaerales bacterium]|nr:XylR family transcriptional regulator [Phycisphaerales bacterium]
MTVLAAPTQKKVVLLFDRVGAYAIDVLRGIRRFADTAGNWSCVGAPPVALAGRVLRHDPPDGVIAGFLNRAGGAALAHTRIPVVDTYNWFTGFGFPRVLADDVAVGREAAAHLLERGIRRFAVVGALQWPWAQLRAKGFTEHLREQGYACETLAMPEHPGKHGSWSSISWSASDESLRAWVARQERPMGLFGVNDHWALRLTDACSLTGIRVPEDALIIGVDNDTLLCELARPPMSSVRIDAERIGYEAAALLSRMMAGDAPPKQAVLVPPRGVVVRRSTEFMAIDDADVVEALRLIRSAATRGLSVDHVLAAIPASRRTLERRFRKLVGRGMQAEIRRVRLEHAKTLLRDTDLQMPAVAKKSGFSGPERMAKFFRLVEGRTPREYRNQHRVMR